MTNIEDRLTTAADRLRHEIDETVDVESALAQAGGDRPERPSGAGSRWPLLLAAAAVIALVAAAGVVIAGDDSDDQFVASEGTPTSTPTSQPDGPPPANQGPPFAVLAEIDHPDDALTGRMYYAGSDGAFAEMWAEAAPGEPMPDIDFDRQIVLGVTQIRQDPCGEHLKLLERDGSAFVTVLAPADGDQECAADLSARTFIFSVDRSDVPSSFTLVLPAAPSCLCPQRLLDVDLSTDRSMIPPTVDPQDPTPLPDPPELRLPEEGNDITFSSVAGISIGQVLDPSEVSVFEAGGPCGYWGPGEPSHDGDEPLGGVSSSVDPDAPTVATIMVRNPKFRTASGVGMGTTLASLERIYPDLVVDRLDGWENPTDGLLGSYNDVAAVRNGDFALTFLLRDDVVDTVKVSYFTDWGDDEGCA